MSAHVAEGAQLFDELRGAQARLRELLHLLAHERHQLLPALVVESCAQEQDRYGKCERVGQAPT